MVCGWVLAKGTLVTDDPTVNSLLISDSPHPTRPEQTRRMPKSKRLSHCTLSSRMLPSFLLAAWIRQSRSVIWLRGRVIMKPRDINRNPNACYLKAISRPPDLFKDDNTLVVNTYICIRVYKAYFKTWLFVMPVTGRFPYLWPRRIPTQAEAYVVSDTTSSGRGRTG